MDQKIKTDVVVIGGGLAGMTAAQAACSQGARVLIVDRTGLGMATNTAMSNGVFAGPTGTYDAEAYQNDTLRIGRSLNRPWMVRKMAQELPGAIDRLRASGLEIEEKNDHYFVVSASSEEFPGARLARVVAGNLREDRQVVRMGGMWVDRILVAGGRAAGISAYDPDGRRVEVRAGSVIIATGGAGAIYQRNDNQKSTLGQGYLLAAQAGLALWDMEFVQYYPVVMAQDRLPAMMLNSPHPEGSRILTADGRNLADVYGIEDINHAIRNRRDWLSAIMFEEWQKGPVYMDYRSVADPHWERHPLVLLKKRRFDFRSRPVMISPAAHFMMGGLRIEPTGVTDLPGLFACGEVVWGLHGACRKGGNALAECLVFGRLAGVNAANALGAEHRPGAGWASAEVAANRHVSKSRLAPRDIRRKLQAIAWENAGVVRHAGGLREGLKRLEELRSEIEALSVTPPKQRRTRFDLISMATVLRAILSASLARRESRGCFIRRDCPEEDNAHWLKNSCVKNAARYGEISVSHHSAG